MLYTVPSTPQWSYWVTHAHTHTMKLKESRIGYGYIIHRTPDMVQNSS